MVVFFSKLTQSIIVALIITIILEMLLPDGSSKKYVKMVLGLYVLMTIISPIVNVSFTNLNFENTIKKESYIGEKTIETISLNVDESIERVYKENITREIKQYLSSKGFELIDSSLTIETEDENKYGMVKQMELTVKENNNNVNYIQEVEIGENLSGEHKTYISVFESIEDYFQNNYGVDKKNIIINI